MTELELHVKQLYPDHFKETAERIEELIGKWRGKIKGKDSWIDQSDVLLITYGDGIKAENGPSLPVLKQFADEELKGFVSGIHLLPVFPYTSDDGFSVSDFRAVQKELGDWEDIKSLGQSYDLMLDAVVNHASRKSEYFQGFLKGEEQYRDFFIEADPCGDYSLVTRPRALPLLTAFETEGKKVFVWTTFSEDQIDFNYKNDKVLLEILDVLLFYASKGAGFIRLDAAGFIWKEAGTTCMNLPQAHELVKIMRLVLDRCAPGCTIITETNVPHQENIRYFGNGFDEAGLVYQFPLPPLTFYSFISGSAVELSRWAGTLKKTSEKTAYFNFLASHDGIGMRPVEDILTQEQKQLMADTAVERGGLVSLRSMPDGSQIPYELNISYLSAIAGDEEDIGKKVQKFMASQCILLSVMGLPAIYYHSLLGSENSWDEYLSSGIKRRINREKLDYDRLKTEIHTPGSLRNLVFEEYKRLIAIRKMHKAFAPNSPQTVLELDSRLFALVRGEGEDGILVLVNVSNETVQLDGGYKGVELLTGKFLNGSFEVPPYGYMWVKRDGKNERQMG
ncbi:MAG: sugar phosphorylase [Clostridiaceae bacterium]|nr:sugar phosphorylase [Clostridiaceae bacterium]